MDGIVTDHVITDRRPSANRHVRVEFGSAGPDLYFQAADTAFAFIAAPLFVIVGLLLLVGLPIAALTTATIGDVLAPIAVCGWSVGNFLAFGYCVEEVWR